MTAQGRIVTFYSFKGGVGRTMALANVAFIAAAAGRRVLVIDWDLEAPGLAYYFRGMQEGSGARAVRTAPGMLDIAWRWSTGISAATSTAQAEALAEEYREGAPFREAVRSLIPYFDEVFPDRQGLGGTLDMIGAGNATIEIPRKVAYEEALSRFDWRSFFGEEAGGAMVASLRDWCKANYDYVLVDSRTGYADVAGICTMQLPDIVALCFIYNRQNIDGIAQIAGAIRSHRGNEVQLRAAPMKTARENTTEEASAKSRTRKELMRRGGFSPDAVDGDLEALAVQLASNVPFYETVAMVASSRSRNDPLVLDYINLASALLGEEFILPEISDVWADAVRRRLQPRQATTDYVLKLKSTEPERAFDETLQLLEGALEDHVDGEVDPDYAQALIDMAAQLAREGGAAYESVRIMDLALDLARGFAETDPAVWQPRLVDAIEVHLEQLASILDEEEELLLLDEADQLLAELPGEANLLRRIVNRRRAARVQLTMDNIDSANQIVGEFQKLARSLGKGGASLERTQALLAADIDALILKGDLNIKEQEFPKALKNFKNAVAASASLTPDGRPELVRLRYDVLSRLARLVQDQISPQEAALYAVEALDWAAGSNAAVFQFVELGNAVARAGDARLVRAFLLKAFLGQERRTSQFQTVYGRSERTAARFVEVATGLLEILIEPTVETMQARSELLSSLLAILRQLARRSFTGRTVSEGGLAAALGDLLEVLQRTDIDGAVLAEIRERAEHLAKLRASANALRRTRPS